MKKVLALILIVLMLVLSGCSREPKTTVERWAVKYAIEYMVDEFHDDTYMINVEDYEYGYDNGIFNTGVFIENDEYVWKIYKLEITYVGDVYEGVVYEVYVGIAWIPNYSLLDFNAQVKLEDDKIRESQIIEIEIEVALYD
jgi:hypothetical protein